MRFRRRASHDREILEDGPASLVLVDRSGVVMRASREARAVLGDCEGRPLRDLLVLDDAALHRWLDPPPGLLWGWLPSGAVVVASPSLTTSGVVLDIAQVLPELVGARPGTPHWGLTDGLTGVFNRHGLQLWWDNQIEQPKGWVLWLGVRGLRDINNRLGPPAGDHVIHAIAGRLVTGVPLALVFRFTGKDFVAVLPDLAYDQVRPWVEELATALMQPIELPRDLVGEPLTPRVSIGVARLGDSPFDAAHRADELMFKAKGRAVTEILIEGED